MWISTTTMAQGPGYALLCRCVLLMDRACSFFALQQVCVLVLDPAHSSFARLEVQSTASQDGTLLVLAGAPNMWVTPSCCCRTELHVIWQLLCA